MNAIMVRILMLVIGSVLLLPLQSLGGDKIFTNEDLKKYQDKGRPAAAMPLRETASHSAIMRRRSMLQPLCTDEVKAKLQAMGGGCEEWMEGPGLSVGKQQHPLPGEEVKPRLLSADEPVAVRIAGCQTLQEAMDGRGGNTNAVITVRRRGRTIEEICETLGRGCKTCAEAPPNIGREQLH